MKTQVYNDGKYEAGLCMLLRQGPYYDAPQSCLNLGRSEHAQPTLLQCHLFIHALHGNLQCAGQQWAGRRTNGFTSIYNLYIQDQ